MAFKPVTEEEAIKTAQRMTHRIRAMCLECPNKSLPYSDICNDHCVIYDVCWEEQEEEEKVLKGVSILEEVE